MADTLQDIQVGDEVVMVSGYGAPTAHKLEVTKVTAKYFDAGTWRWRKDNGKESGNKETRWHSTRVERLNERTQEWLDKTEHKELVLHLSNKLDKLPLAALRTIDELVKRAEWFEQNPPPHPEATLGEKGGD